MSDLSIALITGGFTLGAVALTFGGTIVTDWLRNRRAARDARDAAIASCSPLLSTSPRPST